MKRIKKRYVGIIILFILGIFLYSPDIPLKELKRHMLINFQNLLKLKE